MRFEILYSDAVFPMPVSMSNRVIVDFGQGWEFTDEQALEIAAALAGTSAVRAILLNSPTVHVQMLTAQDITRTVVAL